MKVIATPIEQSQIVLDIEVEQERVDRALDQAYRRTVNRLKVPGFRPGKAPRHIVERMVGRESLLEDAVDHLVPQVFQDALEDQQLKPVARPRLEVVSVSPLQVKATVPIHPTVELGEYRSITLPRPEASVSDEDVQGVINRLRESHAEWVPVERGAQAGDLVGIAATVKDGDETLMEAEDAEFIIDPEGANPVPEFSQHLLGKATGESADYTVSVPEDFVAEQLRGKTVDVAATLHWIKEKQLPELDDAFASTIGEHESIDALRSAVRADLEVREIETLRSNHQEEVIRTVVEQATFEVPPQLIEDRAHEIQSELERALEAQRIPIEQYKKIVAETEEEYDRSLHERGERAVRRSLVLEAVAAAENIEIAEADVRAELEQVVAGQKNAQRLVDQAMARPETRQRIESALRERRAVALLVDLATGTGDTDEETQAAQVAEVGEPSA